MPASGLPPADPDAGAGFPFTALLAPAAYPHPVRAVRLRETYISWVLLTGEFAYKIKKPVHFDFLDAATLERRGVLCEEELRLNQRLAKDLYLGVVAVTQDAAGHRINGTGPVVEYAVFMREFAAADELDQLLAHARVATPELSALGARLADFHGRAAVAGTGSAYGGYDAVRHQVMDNLATLRATLSGNEALRLLARFADWTEAAMLTLEPVIRLRKDAGAVRECHGDLHARNIVRWHGALTPFDCLEFEPALRWIDVASDVAFVFMDLAAHDRTDLGTAFLNGYLEHGGDYEGLRLLQFYAVYRALVRAKVDALGAQHAPVGVAKELRARLANRLNVAARLLERRQPVLIVMNGVTASGKSWVSADLMLTIGAVRVRSDLERKRLAGVAPLRHRNADVGSGDYDAATTNQTYARLADCAAAALDSGYHVIVDAAFLKRGERARLRALAAGRHCPFLIVACSAPRELLDARVAKRAAAGNDPSEATAAVLVHQLEAQDPLAGQELGHAIIVQTATPQSLAYGSAAVAAWVESAAPVKKPPAAGRTSASGRNT